jgi:hypothetical protein
VLQDRATSSDNHERFVRRVATSGTVWGLRGPDGWATCDSVEHEDAEVMPFWSDRAYAQRAARDAWADYVPTPIAFDDFIDKWLKGMHDDGVLAGTNWDTNNCGLELDPRDLARQLLDAVAGARPEITRRPDEDS